MRKYFENSINFSCGMKLISVAGIVADRQREGHREGKRKTKKEADRRRERDRQIKEEAVRDI